jgi:molecular chaperone GrpE
MTEKKENFEQCKKERDQYLKGWKRSQADLLNYKKEESQRMAGIARYEREKIIKELIGILDDIFLAEKAIPQDKMKNAWVKGILGIKKQIESFFERMGVEKIDSVGKPFDPRFHEAVEMTENKKRDSGTVAEEVKRGYKIGDEVIAPAKVKVVK